MTGKSRTARMRGLEAWADRVTAEDLEPVDAGALRVIAELADRRAEIEADLERAVRLARRSQRTWSEIGLMLGVSKQAAQRKYGPTS